MGIILLFVGEFETDSGIAAAEKSTYIKTNFIKTGVASKIDMKHARK